MKPETAAFLDKARECLAKADGMLANWLDEAGRAAYLADLHTAEAFPSASVHDVSGQFAR